MVLIDKESLIEHMRKAYKGNTKAGFKWDLVSAVAVIGAEEEITPDAEPIRHGHWIHTGGTPKSYMYMCTNCRWEAYFPPIGKKDGWKPHCDYDYCPWCGAKMDAKGEEQ